MLRKIKAILPLILLSLLLLSKPFSAKAQNPTADFDISDTVYCVGNAVTFSDLSVPGPNPINAWSWTFGDGGVSTLQDPTHTYNIGGNYSVTLIVTDALGLKDTVVKSITIVEAKVVQNVIRVCSPQDSATVVAINPATVGVVGSWLTSAPIVINSIFNDTTLVTGLDPGINTLFWVVSLVGCSDIEQINIFVDLPINANAGPDQQICETSGTANLSANNPNPGSGRWTTTTSALISNPNNRNTTVTGLTVPGSYPFVWTITNGACITRDTVVITVVSQITPNAGPDQSICVGSTVTLAGNSPSPGTGLWTALNGGTITTTNSPTSTVTGLTTAGIYNFVWTITRGACVSRDTVQITVTSIVVANAGADQLLCATTTATLAGSNPSPGTGLWTTLSGATITTPTSATSGITGLATGNNVFIWTVTNGACISRDTMLIVNSTLISSNAGPDQSICAGSTITLAGNSPSPGTGLWTALNGGTITTTNSPTSTVTGLTTAGIYNFVWTITNGACVSRDTVQIIVTSIVVANAGADQLLCATTTATLAGSNPSPGTGLWTTLSGATITTPTSATSGITGLATGNNVFIWTVTNGTCISRDTMVIVNSTLISSNAGPDQSICVGSTVTLAGNSPSPGTGLWTALNGGTITTTNSPTSTVTGLTTAGTYNFVWTITRGACISRDTVKITVSSNVVSNAGPDQQICETTTSISLAGNNPSPGTGLWTKTNGGTISSPTNPNSLVTGLTAGTYSFIWTISNGACISRDTMTVVVNNQVASNAGLDDQICQGSIGVLSANNPTPAIGLWITSSSASISNPNSPNTNVTNLNSSGIYNFIWTVSNGACVLRDTVRLIVDTLVAANAGADQLLCATTTATIAGSNPSPGTGLWTTLSGATITTPTSATSGITGLATGNNVFIWTVTNGACISRDTMVIIYSTLISSNAGPDQNICAGSTITLAGNNPSSGTGLWTALNGGTITNTNSPTSAVTGLTTAGTYNFVWTINNGACISSDTIKINVDSLIVADAGVDQKYCEIFTTTLAANNFTPGLGTWSSNGTAIIVDPNDPTTNITNLSYGANEFIWTIVNGTCVSTDTIIVNVDSLIIANAGIDQTICAGSPLTLSGNSPGTGESNWAAIDAGTIADPTLQTILISDLNVAGIYSFDYSISNGVCFSADSIIVTVDSLITANAGTDQTLCKTFISTLDGNIVTAPQGSWTTLGSATFADANDPLTNVSNLDFGDNIFIWSITNGVCISTDTITIRVDSLIVADAGTDQTICSTVGSTTLNSNDPLSGQGLWTTSSTAIFADSSLFSTLVSSLNFAGTYQFIWTISNGVCVSNDTLIINVDSNEVANAGADQQFCESITSANLNATPAAVGIGIWTSLGSATLVDDTDPNTQVDNLVIGNNLFVYTITNGTCISIDTTNINISQFSTTANAGPDQEQCATSLSAIITGNTPLVGSASWTSLSNATVDSVSSVSTTVSNLQVGSNLFVYTIINGACSSSDTVNVIVNPLPVVDAGTDQYVVSLSPVAIGGTPTAIGGSGSYSYAWSPASVLNDSTLSNPTATVNSTTSFIVLVTDSLGCQGLDTIIVWVNNPPIALNDTVSINEDSTIVISVLLNDTDIDNNIDPVSLSNISGPFNGSIVIDPLTGIITYTPNSNYFGADSIYYTVCDSGMPVYCDTAWIYISILPINDAPLAIDDTASTVKDSCIQIAVLANDSDVENAIITSSLTTFSGPSNGTLSLDTLTGIITYCPDSGFVGVDTFYYAICDSGFPAPGLCDTAVVIINVNANNSPPIALNDSAEICSSDSVFISILGNDLDPDNDSLSASILTPPSNGTASIGTTFELNYTPDSLFNGIDSIQYVVCDNQSLPGCDTAWVYINVHVAPQISFVTNNIKCFGDSTGTVDLTVVGNTPYTYNWNNGSIDEDIDSLIASTYTVLVTDTFGCTVSGFATVSQPTAALSGLLNIQPILCNGDSSGAFDLVVTGGVTPYTFTWSNGATDEDIDSLVVGNYTVIVADSNGCIVTLTDSITQPDSALSAITSIQNVVCGGDSTGGISINVVGGSGGYLYAWSNSATSSSITNLSAGIYTVTIYDSNNCQLSVTDSVQDINAPISIVPTTVSPNCLTGILGSISIITSGGVGNYIYAWSTGDSTNVIDTLTSGSYTLTVSDSLGCSDTISISLIDTSSVNINVIGNLDICEGDSIVLETSNLPGASYVWSQNGNILSDTTYQLVVDSAGVFDVTITNGCGVFTSSAVTTTLNSIPVLVSSSDISVPCDSLITLSVSGASTYSWYPANLVSDSTGSLVTVSLDQTTTFIVTGLSAVGCSSLDTIIVTVTCDTLFLPSGFSPNGDGKNDFFVISNLSKYPNATLKIFNRWGSLVYIKDRYDNSWNGFSNSDKIRLGEELPNGTYYYVFEPNNGEESKQGFVILRR